jgi:hypothetical protein
MLLSKESPYYTHDFGSVGPTLESALQSEFFQWFHMEETERHPDDPGEAVRFRPSGEKFHDLCYLDVLIASRGELIRMELVVQRAFLDGTDNLFAQDLVKSFFVAVLPDACKEVLQDFMREMNVPGGNGVMPGFLVFRGRRPAWRTQTGRTRLLLANLPLTEAPVLVVQVCPNPTAPNAVLIEEKGAGPTRVIPQVSP